MSDKDRPDKRLRKPDEQIFFKRTSTGSIELHGEDLYQYLINRKRGKIKKNILIY